MLGFKGTEERPCRRWHFALANYKDQAIVLSGGFYNHSSGEILAFSLQTNTWIKKSAMSKPRSYHASCSLGEKVYFFCGRDFNQRKLNSVEWYSFATGQRGMLPDE